MIPINSPPPSLIWADHISALVNKCVCLPSSMDFPPPKGWKNCDLNQIKIKSVPTHWPEPTLVLCQAFSWSE